MFQFQTMRSWHQIIFMRGELCRMLRAEKRRKRIYILFESVGSRLVSTTLLAIFFALFGAAQTQINLLCKLQLSIFRDSSIPGH